MVSVRGKISTSADMIFIEPLGRPAKPEAQALYTSKRGG
jgi:hypothetical protein